jgi:hypothetical protein
MTNIYRLSTYVSCIEQVDLACNIKKFDGITRLLNITYLRMLDYLSDSAQWCTTYLQQTDYIVLPYHPPIDRYYYKLLLMLLNKGYTKTP